MIFYFINKVCFWSGYAKPEIFLANSSDQEKVWCVIFLLIQLLHFVYKLFFQGDPVKDLVRKYLGEQEASKRPTLHANQVAMNENGLKKLLVRNLNQ